MSVLSRLLKKMAVGLVSAALLIWQKVSSSSTRKKVTSFNEETFGTVSELRAKAMDNTHKRIGADFISAIDDYYSDIKNKQAKDSVG